MNDFETVREARKYLPNPNGFSAALDRIEAEVKRLQTELSKWEARFPKGVAVTEMECLKLVDEIERLRKRLEIGQNLAGDLSRENERLQAIIQANDNYDQDATEREVERLRVIEAAARDVLSLYRFGDGTGIDSVSGEWVELRNALSEEQE